MRLGIFDVREWQTMVDIENGRKVAADGSVIRMVKQVMNDHPYPGDISADSNRWVTDISLELTRRYQPDFAFICYSQPYFTARFDPISQDNWQQLMASVFAEVDRFLDASGFTPVIVGSGDMIPLKGYIDLSGLDGLAIASNWAAHYAGLYHPSSDDFAAIRRLSQIERVVSREEFLQQFDGGPEVAGQIPDYLLVAAEGYAFKALSTSIRPLVKIPAHNDFIPVYTSLGTVSSITGIRSLIESRIDHQKVALILIEGIGTLDFPLSCQQCSNGRHWYSYEPGDCQYLALTTGQHQFFEYSPGYRYYLDDNENQAYPFSGYFDRVPASTLADAFSGRSIAVGNRSMLMHITSGTDIAIECFSRKLYNHGLMAAIKQDELP